MTSARLPVAGLGVDEIVGLIAVGGAVVGEAGGEVVGGEFVGEAGAGVGLEPEPLHHT